VLTLAVTGGIGSGKSTVSAMLSGLGAEVVDSDALARQVVAPGTPGLAAVAEAFGRRVLAADGSLDRAALAAIVFHDTDARHRLEAITHPLVRAAFRAARDAASPQAIVVNDIPLVRTLADAAQFHLVITVAAEQTVRVRRLVGRGLTESDARARMRSQISDVARRTLSDVWLDNGGDESVLRRAVGELWSTRLLPFRDNLLAGRPAARGHRARPLPGCSSPIPLLCARVSAAAEGLPCEPDPDADAGTVCLRLQLADLTTADRLAPALARAGFPRASDGAGFPCAGVPVDTGRWHVGADPGCPVTLRLTVAGRPA